MSRGRVVVAMSGGVDSSVAAALLVEAGYEVIGVTLRLHTPESQDELAGGRGCCSIEGIEDARRVCALIGIPFYALNFEEPFRRGVIDYFAAEYAQGRTPNPCLACNRHIKFDVLLRRVEAWGFDYLATGHYARISRDEGGYRLLKAVDAAKDQSYVLYTLGQSELRRLLFPVEELRKAQVREHARRLGLPVAEKPESQEICFVPDGRYGDFLSRTIELVPGPICDASGQRVGTHRGLALYTVGQRRGLGLGATEPRYVLALRPEENALVVGSWCDLLSDRLCAEEVSFVSGRWPGEAFRARAKVRYRSPESEATVVPLSEGTVEVRFDSPQRALTPGQAVVFYRGEEVLGGGCIAA